MARQKRRVERVALLVVLVANVGAAFVEGSRVGLHVVSFGLSEVQK